MNCQKHLDIYIFFEIIKTKVENFAIGALGALVWGTWGTRLGHLGHSFGELGVPGVLVWGTRLGHLRHSSGALEALHQEPMYLMQSSEALGALVFDAPKDNLTHLSEADV